MKYKCEIVRDLMPLYLDGIASTQSRQMVDEHLFLHYNIGTDVLIACDLF